MRDLTEEELKLAPEGATHYYAFDNGDILFECSEKCCMYKINYGLTGSLDCNGVCKESKPITRKPFDITEHEVSNHVTVLESGDIVVFGSGWIINKDRAIAIAKALGVTGEDLK